MVGRCGVWIESGGSRINMDYGVREVRDVMKKLVVSDFGNGVSARHGLCSIDAEPYLGEQSVSHPSSTDLSHRDDTWNRRNGL